MGAYAAFIKESRMTFAETTNLDRKSGVAQWRDLQFLFSTLAGDLPLHPPWLLDLVFAAP
jgi:hypothetical protein